MAVEFADVLLVTALDEIACKLCTVKDFHCPVCGGWSQLRLLGAQEFLSRKVRCKHVQRRSPGPRTKLARSVQSRSATHFLRIPQVAQVG